MVITKLSLRRKFWGFGFRSISSLIRKDVMKFCKNDQLVLIASYNAKVSLFTCAMYEDRCKIHQNNAYWPKPPRICKILTRIERRALSPSGAAELSIRKLLK